MSGLGPVFQMRGESMKKTLCALLIVLPLVLLFSAAPVKAEDYRFVVISDTHMCVDRSGFSLYAATKSIVDSIIGEIKPKFVIDTGDMISINTMTNSERDITAMWKIFDTGVRDRLTSAGIAFFPSPGNHDVFGLGRSRYRQNWSRFSNRSINLVAGSYSDYYAFRCGSILFISLDGSGLSLGREQESWLESTIDKYRHRNGAVVVFSHVGLVGRGRHPNEVLQGNIMSIVKRKNVKLYISGHQHFCSKDSLGPVTHISAGSAGETPPFNYLVFNVHGSDIQWETKAGMELLKKR
jgi:3',5'-cyclic AMP phosphodiesterase CpdA